MSWQASGWAIAQGEPFKLTPKARHVLLVMGHCMAPKDRTGHMHEDGWEFCWPTVKWLMEATGYARSTLFEAIRELVDKKVVAKVPWLRRDKSQTSNVYMADVKGVQKLESTVREPDPLKSSMNTPGTSTDTDSLRSSGVTCGDAEDAATTEILESCHADAGTVRDPGMLPWDAAGLEAAAADADAGLLWGGDGSSEEEAAGAAAGPGGDRRGVGTVEVVVGFEQAAIVETSVVVATTMVATASSEVEEWRSRVAAKADLVLRPEKDLTVNQRAKRLADAWYEMRRGVANHVAAQQIVKKAVNSGMFDDRAILYALWEVRRSSRPLTVESLMWALERENRERMAAAESRSRHQGEVDGMFARQMERAMERERQMGIR